MLPLHVSHEAIPMYLDVGEFYTECAHNQTTAIIAPFSGAVYE